MSFPRAAEFEHPPTDTGRGIIDDPALGLAYLLAGGLMEVCGPLFWAVLVVGFVFAELSGG